MPNRPRELSNSSWASTSSQESYGQPVYQAGPGYGQQYGSPSLYPPVQQQLAYPISPDPSPLLSQDEGFHPAGEIYAEHLSNARFASHPQAPAATYTPPTPDPSSSSSYYYSQSYPPPQTQYLDAHPLQYPPSAYRALPPPPPLPSLPPHSTAPMRHPSGSSSRGPSPPPPRHYYMAERHDPAWQVPPMARAHSQPEPLYERQPGDYQPRGMVAPMPYKYDYEYRHHDVYPLPTLPVPPTPVSYDQRSISWSGSPRASERSAGSDEERHEAITPFVSKLAHLLNHEEYNQVIRWNREGTAFTFAHSSPDLLTVFSRFFRHSNVHSFVRQLNIYSFTRLSTADLLDALEGSPPSTSTEFSGFFHPLLFRDAPGHVCDLSKIKPKMSKKPSRQKLNSHLAPEVRKRTVKVEGKVGGGMKGRKVN